MAASGGSNLLAGGGGLRFDFPLARGGCFGEAFQLLSLGVRLRQFCFASGGKGSEFGEALFARHDLLGERTPIDEADFGAKLLQTRGAFAVAACLARLGPHAAEPAFDFVDNVRKAKEILLDTLEASAGGDLLGFELADPGGFLEDHAAIARRGLE